LGVLEIVAATGAGLCAGFLGSMLGLGGGFIMVPILHIGFKLDMHWSVGTSLAIMIFTAISSSLGYWRQGRIDAKLAKYLAITSIPAVVAGALASRAIGSRELKVIFGVALALAAVRMVTGKKALASHGFKKHVLERRITDSQGVVFTYNVNLILTMIFAGVAGFSAGLLGIGGGIINVPVLTFCGLPIHFAVATSSFLIIFNAATGALSHAFLGSVEYGLAAAMIPGVVVGAQFGAAAAKRFKPKKLQLAFGVMMLLLALRMIAKAFDLLV
jgi:uncharacterized membrane protein YfcA